MWIADLLACWNCFEAIGTKWEFCPWCGVSLAYDRDEGKAEVAITERYEQFEINEACMLEHVDIDHVCELPALPHDTQEGC